VTYLIYSPKGLALTHDLSLVEDFVTIHPTSEVKTLDYEGMHIDFGGSMLMGTEPVEMVILGRRFSFYAHHHLSLLNALNRAIEDPQPGGSVHVTSWLHLILLEEEVARGLRDAILQALGTLRRLEHEYLLRWEEAMKSLAGTGAVVVPEETEPDA
jgi:hypothetical protein